MSENDDCECKYRVCAGLGRDRRDIFDYAIILSTILRARRHSSPEIGDLPCWTPCRNRSITPDDVWLALVWIAPGLYSVILPSAAISRSWVSPRYICRIPLSQLRTVELSSAP